MAVAAAAVGRRFRLRRLHAVSVGPDRARPVVRGGGRPKRRRAAGRGGAGRPRPHRARTPTQAGRPDPPVSIKQLVLCTGRATARQVIWRRGTRKTTTNRQAAMRSHFLALRVRLANRDILRADEGSLPEEWLIVERPPSQPGPVKYWLSNMDKRTSLKTLVRLAKIRWRIEHDYRELKTGLGIDHLEGRSFVGWHRHVTLTVCSPRHSVPCCAWTQKRMLRPDRLRRLAAAATPARGHGRRVPRLQPAHSTIQLTKVLSDKASGGFRGRASRTRVYADPARPAPGRRTPAATPLRSRPPGVQPVTLSSAAR